MADTNPDVGGGASLDPLDPARHARLSLLAPSSDGDAGGSALAHADLASFRALFAGEDGFRLVERSPLGLLQLRVDPSREGVAAAVRDAIGLELPERLGSTSSADRCLRWQGPDRWLLSCASDELRPLERSLREGIVGHCAVVDVSDAFCVLELGGEQVLEVLAKSTGYDLRAERFSPGKVVGTGFAGVDVVLRRIAIHDVELLVRRSLADHLWLWLQRATREYRDR